MFASVYQCSGAWMCAKTGTSLTFSPNKQSQGYGQGALNTMRAYSVLLVAARFPAASPFPRYLRYNSLTTIRPDLFKNLGKLERM